METGKSTGEWRMRDASRRAGHKMPLLVPVAGLTIYLAEVEDVAENKQAAHHRHP